MGRRPVKDKAERWSRFCEAIADGKTIPEACKASGTAWGSLQRWITIGEEAEQYAAEFARARSSASHRHASRILSIIENATPETAQVARLQVDALKWLAGVQNKGAYGDKVTVEATVKAAVTGVIMLPMEEAPAVPLRHGQPPAVAGGDVRLLPSAEVVQVSATEGVARADGSHDAPSEAGVGDAGDEGSRAGDA